MSADLLHGGWLIEHDKEMLKKMDCLLKELTDCLDALKNPIESDDEMDYLEAVG